MNDLQVDRDAVVRRNVDVHDRRSLALSRCMHPLIQFQRQPDDSISQFSSNGPSGYTFSMESTPASLLDQLRGSERGPAWGRFVSLYTPLLAHWAQRASVPVADRADLLQDVFLVLVRVIPTFEYQ